MSRLMLARLITGLAIWASIFSFTSSAVHGIWTFHLRASKSRRIHARVLIQVFALLIAGFLFYVTGLSLWDLDIARS
jgi:hypothetical protein